MKEIEMSVKNKLLEKYKSKRNFSITNEPYNDHELAGKSSIFVVQMHDARNLHYDFRIEYNSVLASWAVPKGPSTDPNDKHLAVRTEDHPYDYAFFEGVIPQGQYGAGPVMVWDIGTYKNLKEDLSIEECLDKGEVVIWLEGEKLKGGYVLIRTHWRNENKNWLLIKMHDEYAKKNYNILTEQPNSALTGRSLSQIEKEES